MSIAILVGAILGLTFTVYAVRKPHWPKPAALRVIWGGIKLMNCPHRPDGPWALGTDTGGAIVVGCVLCARERNDKSRAKRPLQFPRFS